MNLPPPPDRWTIDIANAERVNAISSFGFTERQARFLLNVLLHGRRLRRASVLLVRRHRPRAEEYRLHQDACRAPIRYADRDRKAASRPDVPRALQAALGGRR
jgi:hypothetical protein